MRHQRAWPERTYDTFFKDSYKSKTEKLGITALLTLVVAFWLERLYGPK